MYVLRPKIRQSVEKNIKTNTRSITLSSQYLKVTRYFFSSANWHYADPKCDVQWIYILVLY